MELKSDKCLTKWATDAILLYGSSPEQKNNELSFESKEQREFIKWTKKK